MLGTGQSGPGPGKRSFIRMLTEGLAGASGDADLIAACPEGGLPQNWGRLGSVGA